MFLPVVLIIRGLFICEFSYSRSVKIYQDSTFEDVPSLTRRFFFDKPCLNLRIEVIICIHTVLPHYLRLQYSRYFDGSVSTANYVFFKTLQNID